MCELYAHNADFTTFDFYVKIGRLRKHCNDIIITVIMYTYGCDNIIITIVIISRGYLGIIVRGPATIITRESRVLSRVLYCREYCYGRR